MTIKEEIEKLMHDSIYDSLHNKTILITNVRIQAVDLIFEEAKIAKTNQVENFYQFSP